MELEASMVGLLLILAIAVGAAALAVSTVALMGQRRVRRSYRAFARGSRDDVLTLLERHIDEVRGLRGEVGGLRARSDELRELLRRGISRVATVRYDAFEDMGGRMSFSAALLDERGDGMVLTSINGRTETRTYAKGVMGGESQHNLSDEEAAAIDQAMANGGSALATRRARPARDAS